VQKRVGDIIEAVRAEERGEQYYGATPSQGTATLEITPKTLPQQDLAALIMRLEEEMHEAAADLRFEFAARLRDEIAELKRELITLTEAQI
jgi:excinuclease ABC subunit B